MEWWFLSWTFLVIPEDSLVMVAGYSTRAFCSYLVAISSSNATNWGYTFLPQESDWSIPVSRLRIIFELLSTKACSLYFELNFSKLKTHGDQADKGISRSSYIIRARSLEENSDPGWKLTGLSSNLGIITVFFLSFDRAEHGDQAGVWFVTAFMFYNLLLVRITTNGE